jgi:hypothetical protein
LQTYRIHVVGYWRDKNKQGIPGYSGIYFVYTCKYIESSDTVSLIKLIYVGENDNVQRGITENVSFPYWRSLLATGEELCFSMAEMASPGRTAVRAAIVHELKPKANTEFKDSPWQMGLEVLITGRTKLLPERLTVNP